MAASLAALRPVGPYPVLLLQGEQGSAKSSTARIVRSLIDPNKADLRAEPKEVRDLMIAATNGWFVAFDNLSKVQPWLSDALCRLSTGGGFGCRELYSNDEETLFDAKRPTLLTGIETLAVRGDLLQRALLIDLPAIPVERRRPEAQLWAEFDKVKPFIFGALLTAVSSAIKDLPETRLKELPRMADFALWATAAERGLTWEPGTFARAYDHNCRNATVAALDSSLADAVRKLVENGDWQGTPTELLDVLETDYVELATSKRNDWPKNASALSSALMRLAPDLRQVGIDVERSQTGNSNSKRQIALRRQQVGSASGASDGVGPSCFSLGS
ncbi:MAG: hypothetical protein ACC645_21010 [Pirellulales bacterium]